MGKKTLYHPVSLNVLRGAAEYGGFALGKFRQTKFDETTNVATYDAVITKIPTRLEQSNFKILAAHMNGLYASDVEVLQVWITRRGKLMCELQTHADLPLVPETTAGWNPLSEATRLAELPQEEQ